MKIANAIIHNYRSISHLVLDCGKLAVLLGANNCGKSNVIGAIEFALTSSLKPSADDFNSARDKSSDPSLWVELLFVDLTPQELVTFGKYVLPNNSFRLRKTATLKSETESEVSYNGYLSEPDEWWLKSSEIDKLTKREDVENHAKCIAALSALLSKPGKITKQNVEDFQRAYIKANSTSLKLNEVLETGPFMGVKTVAAGLLPDFYLIPAVRDLSDEIKVKATTMFGRLLQRAIQEMATSNPAYSELKKRLEELVNTLNVRADNATRPTELAQIEASLADELKDWGVKVQIEVTTPEVEKILELGTGLQVDDGSMTSAERKGHGLQRAILFALLRTWSKVVRAAASTATTSPRKASQSMFFAFEEPELFLHPHAQRRLARAIRDLAEVDEHQIMLCTHSTHFVEMDDYKSIVIVSKQVPGTGTAVRYCHSDLFAGTDAKSRKDRFHMASWINPDRGELFFAKKVVLVEGETETTAIPFLADKLGCSDDDVSIIDCGSKFNLPLYLVVLNAFQIPYVVVHDEDPLPSPVPADWDSDKIAAKQRTFNMNAEIAALVPTTLGVAYMMKPDFEGGAGISKSQGANKGKAIAALDYLQNLSSSQIPTAISSLIYTIYGTPATGQKTKAQAAS